MRTGVEALSGVLIRALFRPLFTLLVAATLLAVPALSISQAQVPQLPLLQPLAGAGAVPPAPWQVQGLPQQSKPFTEFSIVTLDGRRVLRVEADSSYGNLVHPLSDVSPSLTLAWQWRVDDPIPEADLRKKAGDDTALKVCVFFDLPLNKIPFDERLLLRLARASTKQTLPAATVCYVWDNRLPVDTAMDNAFTHRLRYIVLQSGSAALGQWRSERRDVAADFKRLFGAESAQAPPVLGVAVGADADNTHSRSLGFVADLVLQPLGVPP